jgi:glycosyl transferase family 25
MNVFYINLDSRVDRREHMEEQLLRLDMPFERISAVDGSSPELDEAVKNLAKGFTGRVLGSNAYACFLSHRRAWTRLLDSSESYAMVLEDDLIMANDLKQYLDSSWIPAEADIIKIETWGRSVSLDTRRLPAGPRSLARLRSKHYGAGGYIISRMAAERLLIGTKTFIDPVDAILFHPKSAIFAESVIYQMVPAPVVQGDRPIAGARMESWSQNSMPQRYHEPDGSVQQVKRKNGQWFRDLTRGARNLVLGRQALIVPFG